MSKVVHLSQCTNKSCTLFICAVVSSTPDTGAASLGYQVHLTQEQLAWATSTVFQKHCCETKHLKQKLHSANTLRFVTYTSETKLHQ